MRDLRPLTATVLETCPWGTKKLISRVSGCVKDGERLLRGGMVAPQGSKMTVEYLLYTCTYSCTVLACVLVCLCRSGSVDFGLNVAWTKGEGVGVKPANSLRRLSAERPSSPCQ